MSKLITNIMEKTIHWPNKKGQTQDEGFLKLLEKTDESKVIDEDDSGKDSERTIDYDCFPEIPPQSPLNVQELCEDPEGEEEQHLISKHKRRFFAREESIKTTELCEDNINEGHLTLSAIKTSIGRSEDGKILFERLVEKNEEELTEKDVLKKILDRVRTEARK